VEDVETCVNALFVLTNSEPEKLEYLMRGLAISKREFVAMMAHVLKGNLDELKDTLKYKSSFGGGGGFKSGPPFKPYFGFASTFQYKEPLKPQIKSAEEKPMIAASSLL
jgi:hypothetical protein